MFDVTTQQTIRLLLSFTFARLFFQSDGSKNGTVEVSLRWQLDYVPPGGVLKAEKSPEDEAEIADAEKITRKPPATPKKRFVEIDFVFQTGRL